ncbi:MAG: CDP-glucose 4,6-dehydratase [Prevotellaceae bacterium]|jgi:CDP-glucose 4,6-dehydratase|nr:CDP-glucose 4,6-dehydratase [Prevotellaceae bacterium]
MGDLVKNTVFGNVYAGKKVLVTGNTGFKGSWLTTWLLELGAEVYGLSLDVPTQPALFDVLGLRRRITHSEADVRDTGAVRRIVAGVQPDFVFHLAAQPIVSRSYEMPVETVTTNVVGTANVLDALRVQNRPCTAVIITSDKCYDNVEWPWGYRETDALGGKDVYSGSKGAAELVCKSYYHSFFSKDDSPVRMATARAGNVVGGGDWARDRIVPDCMRAWSEGRTVEIRSPQATRPWQHVLEPLSGYLLLGQALYDDARLNGERFNFGPKAEHSHTVRELLEALSRHWRSGAPDPAYAITGNIPFHEAGLLKLNCDKALARLRWTPVLDYNALIAFTGEWYYAFYHAPEKSAESGFALTVAQIKTYEQLAIKQKQLWIQEQ